MKQITYKRQPVLEIEGKKIIKVILPSNTKNTKKVVKRINDSLQDHGIKARLKNICRFKENYRLYYGNQVFTIPKGKEVKINDSSQLELV